MSIRGSELEEAMAEDCVSEAFWPIFCRTRKMLCSTFSSGSRPRRCTRSKSRDERGLMLALFAFLSVDSVDLVSLLVIRRGFLLALFVFLSVGVDPVSLLVIRRGGFLLRPSRE